MIYYYQNKLQINLLKISKKASKISKYDN